MPFSFSATRATQCYPFGNYRAGIWMQVSYLGSLKHLSASWGKLAAPKSEQVEEATLSVARERRWTELKTGGNVLPAQTSYICERHTAALSQADKRQRGIAAKILEKWHCKTVKCPAEHLQSWSKTTSQHYRDQNLHPSWSSHRISSTPWRDVQMMLCIQSFSFSISSRSYMVV